MKKRLLDVKSSLLILLTVAVTVQPKAQQKVHMQITATDNAHFVLTDPEGRKTGRDPRGASHRAEGIPIDGIPGANYSFESVGAIPDSNETVDATYYHVLAYSFDSPTSDGIYSIDLVGIDLGQFDLYVSVDPARGSSRQRARFVLRHLVIDQDSAIAYRLTYDGTPGSRPKFDKVVFARTIRQDAHACLELKLLGNSELYKDLSHRADKFEKYLAHKDSSKAREELEDFKDKIEDVRKQTVKKEQKKERREKEFLTKDAYQILQEDVDALLKQLPQRRKGKGWDHDDRDRP
jgi:ElaB/YqjD/DUF883 family membrane-anchored ribosome-binding protein